MKGCPGLFHFRRLRRLGVAEPLADARNSPTPPPSARRSGAFACYERAPHARSDGPRAAALSQRGWAPRCQPRRPVPGIAYLGRLAPMTRQPLDGRGGLRRPWVVHLHLSQATTAICCCCCRARFSRNLRASVLSWRETT